MIIHTSQDVQRIIKSQGVSTSLRVNIEGLKDAFTQFDQYDIRPRLGYHNIHGVFDMMPVLGDKFFAFKYVNCHPMNKSLSLPTIMGMYVLIDAQTGEPVLTVDAAILTAIRTAAMQALACKVVKLHDVKRLGLIGCGAQAEFLVLAMREVLPLEHVYLYDCDAKATAKCIDNLGSLLSIESVTLDKLLAQNDVLITATARNGHQVLFDDLPKQIQMICAVGGDTIGKTELPRHVISQCQIMVEWLEQSRYEGEVQLLQKQNDIHEITKIIQNPLDSKDGCILFDSVGIALEDIVVLEWYYSLCSMDDRVAFCEKPNDPKDLYGQVKV